MSDSIVLNSATLDCPDAGRLADFYAEITGGKVTFRTDGWATIKGSGGRLNFQTAPGYRPPTWPDDASSMQIHLDFDVDDLDATDARVLATGARKFENQPNEHCLVFAHSAGHPFCLSTDDVPDQA